MEAQAIEKLDLFGGSKPWSPVDWTDSDDRVRGGKSQSYLEANSFEPIAHFYGILDIETLGGAGFASQRTTAEKQIWDLHHWDGICVDVVGEKSDSNKYTMILKDSLLPPDPDSGRDQATISWEFDFSLPTKSSKSPQNEKASTISDTSILIPFTSLQPTYRGKLQKDAKSILTGSIKRFSIMNRSFFGTQSGDFSLYIRSISAFRKKRTMVESFMASKSAAPLALVLGTMIFFRGIIWGIDTFIKPS